ncbi:uncharacterized protein [Rhodnius prolixus]
MTHEVNECNEKKSQNRTNPCDTLNKSDNSSNELNSLSDKMREQSLSEEQDGDEDESFETARSQLDDINNDSDSLCSSSQSDYVSQESAIVSDQPINENHLSEGLSDDEQFVWTPYAELHLLNSLRGLRPVGVYYHFYLAMIHDRFTQAMGVNISLNELKNKLNTYYNFEEALKISGEDFPCPQIEFSLPPDEFPEVAEIMAKMEKEAASKEANTSD